MKTPLIALSLLLACLQAPAAVASDAAELRTEADVHYREKDYDEAHKLYEKLAKDGDYHAQGRLAQMYAAGHGESADLAEAYAWAVLAEEGGDAFVAEGSDALLARAEDKDEALKRAEKLKKRYGQEALQRKAQRRAEIEASRRSGTGTGSNLSR